MILEKIETYENRLEERDVYDIMILTNSVSNKALVSNKLRNFLEHIKKPVGREPIKDLIYEGVTPSFRQMIWYLGNCKIGKPQSLL